MHSHTIIVGIDFGTTYSGVAWTTEGCPEDLEVISSWPSGQNKTSDKVPTVMTYDSSKGRPSFRWGFQVSPFAENIHGLKLLLDDSQQNRYGPSLRSKDLLKALGKDPVDVASDYLREIFKVVRNVQVRRLGEAYVESAIFRVVLTVPAVWSDKAKDATLRAAENSGLGYHQLSTISEPEAAALHTLQAIQPNTITNGDTFVVCDAGGGTVDLITYRVKCAEPLDLDEVVKGDGGICGAALLDRRFEEFMKNRLGTQWSQLSDKGRQAMLSSWMNNIKCSFSGTGDDEDDLTEYLVVVPNVKDNPAKGIEDGMMLVDSEDIAKVYEPIIHDVKELIRAQIESAKAIGCNTKAILLVGGFGSSPYLYKEIQADFNSVNVMQPPNAWTSVVRGAVLRGVSGNAVSIRKARRHYGVSASNLFDAAKHPATSKYWDRKEEKWLANKRMSWFVSKGMELSEGRKISLSFFRTVDTERLDLIFKDNLLCCNDDQSPNDSSDLSISTICTMEADLGKVPKSLFELKTNTKGTNYYKISYELEMKFTSASIFFELIFEGTSYGSVKAKF